MKAKPTSDFRPLTSSMQADLRPLTSDLWNTPTADFRPPSSGTGPTVRPSDRIDAGLSRRETDFDMSTVTEIQSAIENLSTQEALDVAAWLDEYRSMIQSSEGLFQRLDEEDGELSGQQWLGE